MTTHPTPAIVSTPATRTCRPSRWRRFLIVGLPLAGMGMAQAAAAGAAGDGMVMEEHLLWLALILMAARLFTPLAARLGLPAVLGELLLGVALGNLGLLGWHYFEALKQDSIISFMAELGVVVLMLQIGLETRLQDLIKVGLRATLVAIVGVILPFVLGTWVIGPWLLPQASLNTYLFLGAALTATSVGITGRVFRDLGRLNTPEARIVLGAAVIDDVLGLIILAVVSGLVQAGSVSVGEVSYILLQAAVFLVGSIFIGRALAPYSSRWLACLDSSPSMLFAQVLATGLFMAWLAHLAGLAPIVGAFAAGLLYEPVVFGHFQSPQIVQEISTVLTGTKDNVQTTLAVRLRQVLQRHSGHQHEQLLEPIGYFFVPVFFVYTGMQVDLHALADPQVIWLALLISVAAISGKLATGLLAGRGINGWVVGWGMVPRGEVGLIFAMVGKQFGVINDALFSIIVIMVILTTLLPPPILAWLIRRQPEVLPAPVVLDNAQPDA